LKKNPSSTTPFSASRFAIWVKVIPSFISTSTSTPFWIDSFVLESAVLHEIKKEIAIVKIIKMDKQIKILFLKIFLYIILFFILLPSFYLIIA
jgi:hypothetical protein